MSLKSLIKIFAIYTCMGVVGCGGSGGSSLKDSDGGGGGGEEMPDANLALVEGVYDASRSDDESYFYINGMGQVFVYDFQQDFLGSGSNCYSPTADSAQINHLLNGGSISFDEEEQVFIVTAPNARLTFTYIPSLGLRNFNFTDGDGNVFASSTGLDININGVNINLGSADSLQTSSVTIEDILGAICNN